MSGNWDVAERFAKGSRLRVEGRLLEVVEDPIEGDDGVWTLTVETVEP